MLGPQFPLSLRPASASDEYLLTHLDNDHQLRQDSGLFSSYSQVSSFIRNRNLSSESNSLLLIVVDSNGFPFGVICYLRQCYFIFFVPYVALMDFVFVNFFHLHVLYHSLLPLSLEAWRPISSHPFHLYQISTIQTLFSNLHTLHLLFAASELPFYSNSSIDTPGLKPCHVTLLSDASSWLNYHLPRLIDNLGYEAILFVGFMTQLILL